MSVNYTSWSTADDTKPIGGGAFSSCHIDQDLTDCTTSEVSIPAWESDPGSWDYEDARKLAEQLLLIDTFGDRLCNETLDLNGGCNPRFKTEFCRNFREKGSCMYGDHCQFAHGKTELRPDVVRHSKYKTKLCQKFWIAGYCAYGPRCNFIHQQEEKMEVKPPSVGGLRPFPPGFRRSSESSLDSGIDSGPNARIIGKESPAAGTVGLPFTLTDRVWNEPKLTSSPPGCYPPDLNLTDINSNLRTADCFKGGFSVPHPEHNPIQPTIPKCRDADYYRRFEAGIWSSLY